LYTIKKVLIWIVILLALTLNQITTVKATPEPTTKVEPYVSTAQVGESFTINITLTDVQNLYGVDVFLQWDASILQVVGIDIRLGIESCPDGVLHEPFFIAKNETIQEEGKYTLAGTSTSPAPPFNGSGNIVKIIFKVTNIGSCKLDLATKLADWPPPERVPRISWPIAHTTIGGFFGHLINISVSPGNATIGENISISGFISPAKANVELTILYQREGETEWRTLTIVTTDEQGNYRYIWQPQEDGKYNIKTTAIIDGKEEASSSVLVTVNVPKQPIWLYIAIIIGLAITIIVVAIVIYRKKLKS